MPWRKIFDKASQNIGSAGFDSLLHHRHVPHSHVIGVFRFRSVACALQVTLVLYDDFLLQRVFIFLTAASLVLNKIIVPLT